MSDGKLLIDLIGDAEGWRDLSIAPGLTRHVREAFASYANERQRKAITLVHRYCPEASVANGAVVVPFPVGADDRVAHWSPQDFSRMYIDVHPKQT